MGDDGFVTVVTKPASVRPELYAGLSSSSKRHVARHRPTILNESREKTSIVVG